MADLVTYQGGQYKVIWRGPNKRGSGERVGLVPANAPRGVQAIFVDASQIEGEAERAATRKAAIEASRAATADVTDLPEGICPEGLAFLPYQRAGIKAALGRSSTLFGDEMGLGKTVQAIGVFNADPSVKSVLILAPASLLSNWRREWTRWSTRPAEIQILRPGMTALSEGVVITNYDVAERLAAELHGRTWDLLIADEAHYLKNPDAKRTQAVVGAPAKTSRKRGKPESIPARPAIDARRRLFLTGTPIPNRPIEGWTLFHALDPGTFSHFFGYAKRYANAHQNGFGWDFSGASNLDELQRKLRESIMVRRLKKDVLTELPAKRRAVVELPLNGAAGVVEREREAWERQEDRIAQAQVEAELAKASDDPEAYEKAVRALHGAQRVAFAEISKVRHETALAKIPYALQYVHNALESAPDEKLVVFAHHHDLVDAVMADLGDIAVKLDGRDAMADRQVSVDRFQTDPAARVFVGSIAAAGVGLTLTASHHVIFLELDWVPGNVTQAEDRTHRIGQTESVLIEHLVLEGSLDARMAEILVDKQRVLDEALDKVHVPAPIAPLRKVDRPATEHTTRKALDEAAAVLTAEEVTAIHANLRRLAGYCDGARNLDGAGFSKIDVAIGHSLANADRLTPRQAALGAKLCRKYRRQLGG